MPRQSVGYYFHFIGFWSLKLALFIYVQLQFILEEIQTDNIFMFGYFRYFDERMDK